MKSLAQGVAGSGGIEEVVGTRPSWPQRPALTPMPGADGALSKVPGELRDWTRPTRDPAPGPADHSAALSTLVVYTIR